MFLKAAAVLLFFGMVSNGLMAQEFGGDPPSTHWRQISTPTSRLIFPAGWDSIATRIAAGTAEIQSRYHGSIGDRFKKVDIVLQKDETLSNAFVALGPYRSEYFMMPPQDAFELGAQSWTDNLMIHEYRHVQQYNNFNVGLSKGMGILFGENGRALANAASIPDWFFEGDAVYNETLLSTQGRGRLPLFTNRYRSLYLENRHYSFMELRNGSLRHYIPGHYELGYLLVAYGREKYGETFWRKVTADAASFRPLFYPMQGAIRKYAGVDYDDFVRQAFQFYEGQWKQQPLSPVRWLTQPVKGTVADYKYPYPAAGGGWVVLRQSYRDIPRIDHLFPDGRVVRLATRDISYDPYFSYNNGKIIYAGYQADTRWGNRDFSVITVVDAGTGQSRRMSSHTKYFSPDISHDGSRIAAVRMRDRLQSDIILMDAEGRIMKTFSNAGNLVYSYPKFSADDRFIIACARNNAGEMALEKIDTTDGHVTLLLPFANRVIGFPVAQGDTILYSCSNRGRDEIWAYDGHTRDNYRVGSFTTGLYQCSMATPDSLVASTFTAEGYRLGKFPAVWEKIDAGDTLVGLYVKDITRDSANSMLARLEHRSYPGTRYPRFSHPFHFHSWSPFLDYPDFSFIIFGQNILNTIQSQLYYTYNADEHYHQAGYTGVYGAMFLQPFIDLHETFDRSGQADSVIVHWNEFNASAGLRLPLNFSAGKNYRYLTLSGSYNINRVDWRSEGKQLLNDIEFMRLRASYLAESQQAPAQIFPRWAQRLSVDYRGSISGIMAWQVLVNGSIYLPGIGKTHSLELDGAFQARDTAGQYLYTNSFPLSRGYDAFNFPRMWKAGINYHFPICYPDWGFGNIVYFLRIRSNLFYDYTSVKSLRYGTRLHLRSYGTEVYFDTKWWNQQPLSLGIRYSRLADSRYTEHGANRWEIILPVVLYR